jgi:hypothetical protein
MHEGTEMRDWISTKTGGYSIRNDGLLYQNGMQYSAIVPESISDPIYRYLGRLLSGHVLWGEGGNAEERRYTIARPDGEIELSFAVPWHAANHWGETPFVVSSGPWCELYYLIAPPWKENTNYYTPVEGLPAELVVIRNHLSYFGRLNDGGVRLRREPSTEAAIFGIYPIKTGFRILEKGATEETIAGQTSVWYKVRLLDGKEGWFFGAFVQNLYEGPNGKAPPWPNVADW